MLIPNKESQFTMLIKVYFKKFLWWNQGLCRRAHQALLPSSGCVHTRCSKISEKQIMYPSWICLHQYSCWWIHLNFIICKSPQLNNWVPCQIFTTHIYFLSQVWPTLVDFNITTRERNNSVECMSVCVLGVCQLVSSEVAIKYSTPLLGMMSLCVCDGIRRLVGRMKECSPALSVSTYDANCNRTGMAWSACVHYCYSSAYCLLPSDNRHLNESLLSLADPRH